MRIYFLRHGIAEDDSADGTDFARKLTPEGIARMREEAQGMARLKMELDLILTSPLPRAAETASIVAETLGLSDSLLVEKRLAPGFRLGDLQRIVEDYDDLSRFLLVGHQPDMGFVAGQLVGCAPFDVKKGGLLRVTTDDAEPGSGILDWMLPPSLLIR